MSALTTRPYLRWLAPAAVAAAILGGGAAIGAVAAGADPTLPPRSAAQLLVDVQTARLDGLSGTVVLRSELGLPELPSVAPRGTGLGTLLSGTHTLRVWYSGPDRARVALLSTLGETDLIRNGRDVWLWSSQENSASHRTLPSADTPPPPLTVPGMTPDQVARAALAAIDPSTRVTTDGSAHVAGRDAYELVLTPRDGASLVGSVRVAIDATEHVPLRVLVYARGSSAPAIEVAFTDISFARPDADQFVFNPPPGAKVEEEADRVIDPLPGAMSTLDGVRSATVGSGWTRVLVLGTSSGALPAELKAVLDKLPARAGGRVLNGSLFSVLVTDDGRVLIGAVSPARLAEVAASPEGHPETAADAKPGK